MSLSDGSSRGPNWSTFAILPHSSSSSFLSWSSVAQALKLRQAAPVSLRRELLTCRRAGALTVVELDLRTGARPPSLRLAQRVSLELLLALARKLLRRQLLFHLDLLRHPRGVHCLEREDLGFLYRSGVMRDNTHRFLIWAGAQEGVARLNSSGRELVRLQLGRSRISYKGRRKNTPENRRRASQNHGGMLRALRK
eukprot:SAG11_NODE_517_length_8815_cov_35.866797_4_plen_196_part_00